MGNTYCDRFSSHFFHSKPLKKKISLTSRGTIMGSVRIASGANWATQKIGQLGTVQQGNFVFELKHFFDALQTF